ncbi:hypothetical protein HP467_10490 [Curtobacterium albidum]|uniref:Uncharacterized protein n=2 Tax=Curtobacterium TaxID=2034 RepID=A0A850DYM8_9MICO|nr:hypothetical protein [Curtobacterium albidum]NUU28533.1 hypothetical protein [Curtobacterium albidum]
MFGRRKNAERSAQQFHQADSREQLFAELSAETRADPEALFTIEVVDHAQPGPALDERAQRLYRTGVTRTPLAAPDPAVLPASAATADAFHPLSRPPFSAAAGDVFVIPDGTGGAVLGHVIAEVFDAVYVAVFRRPEDVPPPADPLVVLATQPVVAGLTLPARFQPGMWEVVGTATPDTRRLLPAYSWGTAADGVQVTDFSGSRSRPASVVEAETVPRQAVVSPFFVDIAFRAVAGVVDWHPDFEHLRYRASSRSVDVFPEV